MNIFCMTSVTYYAMAKVVIKSGVNVFDLCLMRTFINFLIAFFSATMANKRYFADVPKEHWNLLIIRSFVGLLGFTCLVLALQNLQVSVVTVIYNTSPFWTAILSYLFSGSQLNNQEFIFMIGCFFGVFMIATAKDEDALKSINSWHWKLFGVACIFTTAWMYSLTIVFSRIMKDVHFSLLMFHYGWIASVSLIVGLVIEHIFVYRSFDLINIRMFSYNHSQYS